MKLTAIILSKDALLTRTLVNLSGKSNEVQILATISSVKEYCEVLSQDLPDIVFVDAHFVLTETFEACCNIVYEPLFVCIQSSEVQVQEVKARLPFLSKEETYLALTYPLTPVKFHEVIDHALNRYFPNIYGASTGFLKEEQKATAQKNDIFIRNENGYTRVCLDDIFYFENVGEYVSIKTNKGNFIILATMKALERKLDKQFFIKIHRSYIVNVKHIININDTHLTVVSKTIPISRAHKQSLLGAINIL